MTRLILRKQHRELTIFVPKIKMHINTHTHTRVFGVAKQDEVSRFLFEKKTKVN